MTTPILITIVLIEEEWAIKASKYKYRINIDKAIISSYLFYMLYA